MFGFGRESSVNLDDLYHLLCTRRTASPENSYTARLLQAGEIEISKKIGEEAIEVILAANAQGETRLVEEIADLTYHTLVLMVAHGITPEQIRQELATRHAG
jgi:phosphoribosyl-ATP pyrophosphohydrolase